MMIIVNLLDYMRRSRRVYTPTVIRNKMAGKSSWSIEYRNDDVVKKTKTKT